MKLYHVFKDEEFSGKSIQEIKELLTGRVMTCSQCCAQRVCVHAFVEQGRQYYTISCGGRFGGDACGHNIAGVSLAGVINSWNAEIDDEIETADDLDFATEIVII